MSQKAAKFLKKVYDARRVKNTSYSMRAYARDCKVSGGRMSEYFLGKRQLTYGAAISICENSNLTNSEKESLMSYFHKEKQFVTINDETYRFMNHPIVYAILSVFEADDFQSSIDWIAERLGEDPEVIQKQLVVLEKYGLIETNEEKNIVLKQRAVKTIDEIPSKSIRDSHKIRLSRVIDYIDQVPLLDRHVTTITMCMSKEKISLAKQKIDSFLDEMSELLESTEQKEVYELNVQLFPWRVK